MAAPGGEIGWDGVLALAQRHRVEALCWNALKPYSNGIPPEITTQFQSRAQGIAAANLRAAAESARLCQSFIAAGVALLFLKGLTLGAIAYPRPFLKMSADIDLLVDARQLGKAADLLRSAGYAPVLPPAATDAQLERWHERRKESVWWHHDGGFQIDLHTRLADHPGMLAGLGAHSSSQLVPIDAGIALPTLGTDELFAYLCVHGASSAWFRLKWITDLAAFLQDKEQPEIGRLYDSSQKLGAGRAADQALLLASHIFGMNLPEGLKRRIGRRPVSRWLAHLAAQQLANRAEPTERLWGTASIHWSQFGLMPGMRFKLSEATRQIGDMLGKAAP